MQTLTGKGTFPFEHGREDPTTPEQVFTDPVLQAVAVLLKRPGYPLRLESGRKTLPASSSWACYARTGGSRRTPPCLEVDLDEASCLHQTDWVSDSTVWVAVLTGGTAVLASWVTTRGNARAAKIQADSSAQAQRHAHVREMRRSAYLQLIEQAHLIGELYWRVGDVYAQLSGHDAVARVEVLRVDLRAAFDPLMRCCRIVMLEGPRPVADTADALLDAATRTSRTLWDISRGEEDAREHFNEAEAAYRACLERFIHAAQAAMASA